MKCVIIEAAYLITLTESSFSVNFTGNEPDWSLIIFTYMRRRRYSLQQTDFKVIKMDTCALV